MDSAQCACRAARVPPARSHLHTARQAVLRLPLAHRSVCSALAGGISPRQTGRAARRACLGPYAPSARPHLCLVARERMLTRPTSLTRASARCARQAARAPQAPWRRHPARLGRSPLRLARRSVHPAHQVTSSGHLNPTHPTIISHPIPTHPTPSHPTPPHPIPSHPIICQPTLPPPGTYQKPGGTTSCEIRSRGNYVRLTTRPPPPTLTPPLLHPIPISTHPTNTPPHNYPILAFAATQCPTRSSTPLPCFAGTYGNASGLAAIGNCVPVRPGFWSPLGSDLPIACPASG